MRHTVLHEGFTIAVRCAFHPAHNTVFLTASGDGEVRLFDLRDKSASKAVIKLRAGVNDVAFDPFFVGRFAVGANDKIARFYDLRCVRDPSDTVPPAQEWSARQVTAVDCTTARPSEKKSRIVPRSVGISAVEYSPFEPGEVLINYREDHACLYSTTRGKRLQQYFGRTNRQTFAKEIAFLGGGAFVATGGDNGLLYVWEKRSGRLLHKLRADSCIVNSIAAQITAPIFAVSGIDETVKLFEYRGEPAFSVHDAAHPLQKSAKAPQRRHREDHSLPELGLMFPEQRMALDDQEDAHSEESNEWTDADSQSSAAESLENDADENSDTDLHSRRLKAWDILSEAEILQRLQIVTERRLQGNESFRLGNFDGAIAMYIMIEKLLAFHPCSQATADQQRTVFILNKLNIAACQFQLRQHELAVSSCEEILQQDPVNIKALYRQAKALLETSHFGSCQSVLRRALRLSPENPSLVELQRNLQERHAARKAAESVLLERIRRPAHESNEQEEPSVE
eukprot:m.895407 g.895407  ORF g.895407 m.895407 type:complete len:510 (-) comp59996_c0_seq3:1742-3271(-)